jgi:putative transposase
VAYIARLLGTCRFTYNNLLAHRIAVYNAEKKSVSFGELGKKLVDLKSEHPWMREAHSKVLQQSMVNLDTAYKNFFKNGQGFPKFKSKHDAKASCRFPSDAFGGVEGNRLTLIKALKDIHFKCSVRDEKYLNKNQDKVRSATLSRTKTGKHFLSVLIDGPFSPKAQEPKRDVIGIDIGINDFIVASTGERFANLKSIRSNEKRLTHLHKELSRKQKGSKNRNKARLRLAKLHEKLKNKQEHHLHHIVNQLLGESQTIAMEDLHVKGMLRNRKLARSIQELSVHRFTSMLEYKAAWMGRDIVQVGRYFPSSRLCSNCGAKNGGLTLKERSWKCACGASHDRDLNAAINIEREGRRINKIGLSSPDLKPLETDVRPERSKASQGRLSVKKEKNVIQRFING